MVTDNGMKNTMQSKNVIDEQVCYLFSSKGSSEPTKMQIHGKIVNDNME